MCFMRAANHGERKKIRVVKFTIKILFFYCYYSHLTCTSFDLSNRSPTEMKRNENKCSVAGAATIMLCITCLWSLITCWLKSGITLAMECFFVEGPFSKWVCVCVLCCAVWVRTLLCEPNFFIINYMSLIFIKIFILTKFTSNHMRLGFFFCVTHTYQ